MWWYLDSSRQGVSTDDNASDIVVIAALAMLLACMEL
jgi:hypothetical protein